jgi:hypothetical protein
VKLSILGSCVSEDWVHYRDVHAMHLTLPERRQHSSLISVVAQPSEVPDDLGPGLTEWEAKQLRTDLDKSFLPHLAEVKPDGLIIDVAIDALRGVAMFDGRMITNSFMFQKSRLFENFDARQVHAALHEPEAYSRVMATATRNFWAFMEREIRGCRVILHKCRYALSYRDRSGEVRPFAEDVRSSYRRANQSMAQLEAVMEGEMPCEVIAIADDSLLADQRHVWGLGGMHLERSYYTRFQSELDRIMKG